MKCTATTAILAAVISLLLSGCWDSEAEQKAKAQAEHSKKFLDMGEEPDLSKSKGFTP
ncbi:hypothetical protein [Pseudomonas jinjuensis]|uniref:hypothetical protein n=1 Tax=Pseudomonas jinjuensis TaxID=198616 RepID=UPI00146F9809|nr:hypothetical protein [Pseudomonas jinjuensis]